MGEGNGNKTKISLKRGDQWSGVEKRLIELEGRGGRKEDKNGIGGGMIEKVEEGKADGDSY